MLTLDSLREYGADVDNGLARCMNNEAFYLRMVGMAIGDTSGKAQMENAVRQGNAQAAFEAAHALKGVYGNLSLTPVFGPVSEMTEIFRAGSTEGAEPLLEQYLKQFEALKALAEG